MRPEASAEELLEGSIASAKVVRVGDTVRKPWLQSSSRTVAYVAALRERGIDLPQPRGRDDEGRLVLEYIPGVLAMDQEPLDHTLIRRVGALVRSIHDASEQRPVPEEWEVLLPADGPDLICHNDLASWNLILDGDRLVFIDWDGAGPSTRLWDLAYAAISFGRLFPSELPEEAAARLRAFVDGYDAHDHLRSDLPRTMAHRARAMPDLLRRSYESGDEPWGTMCVQGHGAHWAGTSSYVAEHELDWERALND